MCKYEERKPTWQEKIYELEDKAENAESKAEFDTKMDELIAAKEALQTQEESSEDDK